MSPSLSLVRPLQPRLFYGHLNPSIFMFLFRRTPCKVIPAGSTALATCMMSSIDISRSQISGFGLSPSSLPLVTYSSHPQRNNEKDSRGPADFSRNNAKLHVLGDGDDDNGDDEGDVHHRNSKSGRHDKLKQPPDMLTSVRRLFSFSFIINISIMTNIIFRWTTVQETTESSQSRSSHASHRRRTKQVHERGSHVPFSSLRDPHR
jgi:hypothetical protein